MTSRGTTARVLVAARLSRVTSQGKSRIERDDQAAQKWAEGREGCEIVHVTEDPGVSGDVDPWKRPSLGPWLSDPALMAQYDEIVASSIDRLGRSTQDLYRLRKWAEDHHKTLRILSPPLTWPVPDDDFASGFVWDVLGRLAEMELKLIKKRYANQRQYLRENEALIGKPPFGFMVTGEKGSKSLALNPALVPYLRGMIERARRGDPFLSICRWLDDGGVPPSHKGKWNPKSVTNTLRNPALKGRRYEGGKVVLKFDGLMTSTEWQTLQTSLDNRPMRRGPEQNEKAMLTGVIQCERCGGPMYRVSSTTKRTDGTKNVNLYYRCKGPDQEPSQCGNTVPLADIEEWVHLWFTADGPFARTEIVEKVVTPGDDHTAEIAEVEAEIRELEPDADDWIEQAQSLRSERARLKALPASPIQVLERPTGRTVGDVWLSLSDQERRNYLLAAGVKVKVLSSADLRSTPGAEIRFIEGDPHKVRGTLRGILTTA